MTGPTVVRAAADRLELADERRTVALKPPAVFKPAIPEPDGRYRDARAVT